MKFLINLSILLIALGLSNNASAQNSKYEKEFMLTAHGTKLKWENNSFGKSYFHITVNKFNMAENDNPLVIDVNYSMSINPSLQGNIVMKEAALQNTTVMHNYFSPGDIVLEDKTTVWLSKAVSAKMKKEKPIELEIKEGNKVTFTKYAKIKYRIEKKDILNILKDDEKMLSVEAIKASNDKGHYIIMHDSKDNINPLILSMNLPGLNLKLVEVEEAPFALDTGWNE